VQEDRPGTRRRLGIDDVAAELIAIHARRRGDPAWQPPRAEIGRRIAALVDPRWSAARSAAAPPVAPPGPARTARDDAAAPASPRAGADVYAGVRDVFERNERWLRQNASAMDRLVGRLRVDPEAAEGFSLGPIQREVRIAVPAGGRGRGYFALRNESDESREIEVELTRTRGLPAGCASAPRVEISPDRLELAPGASHEIGVAVDCSRCPIGPGDEVELGLAAHSGEQRLAFVWVVLIIEEAVHRA
jgi:hypothetical protein